MSSAVFAQSQASVYWELVQSFWKAAIVVPDVSTSGKMHENSRSLLFVLNSLPFHGSHVALGSPMAGGGHVDCDMPFEADVPQFPVFVVRGTSDSTMGKSAPL